MPLGTTVGLVGVGRMGRGILKNLLEHPVSMVL